MIDDTDPVRHLLGFLDVVCGENDRHAGFAEAPNHVPHVLAQFHVYAGGRLVQEQYCRFVREGLGNGNAALHAARQGHDDVVFLVPQRQGAQDFLDIVRIGRLAEQAAAERHRRKYAFESLAGELLWNQPDS